MYTLGAALQEAEASIGRVDAQAIFSHILGVNRAYLLANHMRILTETEDARIDLTVAQRSMGVPVAYLLGTREFYSREFTVTPDVLIPRPDTETLVEAALQLPRDGGGPISVLDLGTGSGAIAATLALELPGAIVTATDASPAALDVARANAKSLGAKVEFLEGSWYEPVAGRRFDVIVSNPPYVAGEDHHLGEGDLRYEPRSALTDGSSDGLDSIRAIVAGAAEHLNSRGSVLIEHGYDQAAEVAALLNRAGFVEPISIRDLGGIARVAGGRKAS